MASVQQQGGYHALQFAFTVRRLLPVGRATARRRDKRGTFAAHAGTKGPLVLDDFSTFYVGGTIEFSDCNASDCNTANPRMGPGNLSVNAAYIEKASPAKKKYKYPIVLMHGGGHNAQVYMTTPDGREGWFHSFLRRGLEVYVVDGSNRGRAGWDPVKRFKATAGLIAASEMETTDTYSEHTAWPGFRWGPQYGVLYPNSQFPIEALNQYLPQLNPAYRDAEANTLLAANLSALIDKIGPCILLGWSTGSQNIMDAVNTPARAAQVKALIGVEGFNLTTRAGNIALNKNIPMLTVIGDNARTQRYVPAEAHATHTQSGW